MKKLILPLLLLIAFKNSSAQVLKGNVKDSEGNPIAFTFVKVTNQALGAKTDLQGNYQIKFPQSGNFQVVFSNLNYKTITKNIQIMEGQEIIENIKKRPNLPYGERKTEITKSLFLERTNKEVKQLKFKTALYLTELERGDEEVKEISNYIITHYLDEKSNTTSKDSEIKNINIFQEKLNKITNSIAKIAKEKVEVANKQLNKDMSKETRSILKENFILMYEINIKLVDLKLMYEYIITKMISAEITEGMLTEARMRKWTRFY